MIRRREFIAGLGSAAAWPLAARAQNSQSMRRIGVLMGGTYDDGVEAINAFRKALVALGWTEGTNVQIDERWASGESDALRMQAIELVGLKPDVILCRGSRALTVLQRATSTIPLVFVGLSDPVGLGFVTSMARPGGHITGFTVYEVSLIGKLLELLKEIAPNIKNVALMHHRENASGVDYIRALESAAPSIGVKPIAAPVRTPEEIESFIAGFARNPNGGLIAAPDVYLLSHASQITHLAESNRLPVVYPYAYNSRNGGLLSYGADVKDLFRRVADCVNRILRGEKPGELPIQAPAKFELIVNLKAAKAIGLAIPESFLFRADAAVE
jgi:putative tryptophan/tyrosine transport system substrate-binding protein